MPEYPVSKAIRQLIRDPASSDSIDLKETIRWMQMLIHSVDDL